VRVQLAGLAIADPPDRWHALGFGVDDRDRVVLGGVELALGASTPAAHGITGWTLRHVAAEGDIDGLPTAVTEEAPADPGAAHSNGALGVDHVVIVTPDFDRSAAALAHRGMELRRVRQAGDRRQGFRRLGPTIMELVEAPEAPTTGFWGLTIVVADLGALDPQVGPARPAVQPGRHIATLDASAGLSTRLAFMDPE
jgi:catechol 2,3-dioxygenase-like lactoylglutathione lyase family enzyme